MPEFQQLVSHEIVPGHVTTYAFLQNLYERGKVSFEATVLPMNTLGATLFEGLANNAILIAYGVTEIDQLPDRDMQIGALLALLQDDAKNQSSYLIWKEGASRQEVALILRHDYLVSEERAEKLSGVWGHHPLFGRMYLPSYRAGHGEGRGVEKKSSTGTHSAGSLRLQGIGGYPDDGRGDLGGGREKTGVRITNFPV